MAFSSSTPITTSIAIYPNTNDTWDVLSPFPGYTLGGGDVAFVMSTGTVCNDGSLVVLPSRLLDVGKFYNGVNFYAKTKLTPGTDPITNGIGGMSKLKDFNFTMSRSYLGINIMDRTDVINLLGRKIVLFLSESDEIETIASSEIKFTGRIFSIPEKSNEQITLNVRGLLNTANSMVEGAIVNASDDSKETEAIVFGDSGDMYIPISKKKDDFGKISLQFTQSDDYIIKELFVKSGSDSEPVYLSINTPHTITDDTIIFDTALHANTRLLKDMVVEERSILVAHSYYEVAIALDDDLASLWTPTINDRIGFLGWDNGSIFPNDTSGHTKRDFRNDLIFKRTETVTDVWGGDVVLYIFAAGWEFVHGYLRAHIEAGSWEEGGNTYYPYLKWFDDVNFHFIYTKIDYVVTGERINPLDKEIDALPQVSNWGDTDDDWDGHELKEVIQQYDDQGAKIFQWIPKDPLLIQVGDEKMLVVYTEKDSQEPSYETVMSSPEATQVWVVRGWEGTTIATHVIGDAVEIISDPDQKIIATLDRKLQGVTTITPSRDFIFSDFQKWLDGTEDLTVQSMAGSGSVAGVHDPVGFIGLDWKLPDLNGDLYRLVMEGDAETAWDASASPFTTDENKLKQLSINLALNNPYYEDDLKSTRRIFGENQGVGGSYQKAFMAIRSYMHAAATEVVTEGKYNLEVSGDWRGDFGFGDTSLGWAYGISLWSKHKNVDVADYTELQKTSMFIAFNSSNLIGRKSNFKISLPTLKISVKLNLDDVDIYAKIVPKNVFDNFSDEFTGVGANCKIAWHPKRYGGGNANIKGPNILTISDDDVRCFGYIYAAPNSIFDTAGNYSNFTTNAKLPGLLIHNLNNPNDTGKIFPLLGHKEALEFDGGAPTVESFVRDWDYTNGLINVGKTFLERIDDYVWVDQVNNRILIAAKQNISDGNPVSIIETLLTAFFLDVTLDTASFTLAKAQRLGWNARILIKEGVYLIKLIDQICKEHGLICYENNKGEVSIVALEPPGETPSTDIDDTMIIYKRDKTVDYKEQFTQLDYLISAMDVYYNFIANKFQGVIESDEISEQSAFTVAQQFTENEMKVKLQLKTIFEQATADKSAVIKLFFHQIPTRLLDFKTHLGTHDVYIGEWVTCSASGIADVSGKEYLILGIGEQVPFKDKKTYIEYNTFEIDLDALVVNIQEVPEQSVNTNYDEKISALDDIEEVPNA